MHWVTVSSALGETRYLEWSQVISGLTVTVAAISLGRADRSVGKPNAIILCVIQVDGNRVWKEEQER